MEAFQMALAQLLMLSPPAPQFPKGGWRCTYTRISPLPSACWRNGQRDTFQTAKLHVTLVWISLLFFYCYYYGKESIKFTILAIYRYIKLRAEEFALLIKCSPNIYENLEFTIQNQILKKCPL